VKTKEETVLNRLRRVTAGLVVLALLFVTWQAPSQEDKADPLPSWNDGPAKKAILDFVRVTTEKTNPKFVPPEARIVTFDEDGTTWVEHPMYTEVVFSLDRLVELAPKHPEWKDKQPFKAVITDDKAAMEKFTLDELMEVVVATHTGVTTDEFDKAAKDWIAKAKHPRWKRPYTDLVYQPMLEVMRYLRANGYKTYIVTGGTQPFVRAFAEEAYGIPPEQIVGTAVKTKFTPTKDGNTLILDPKLLLNNNYSGKAEDIYLFTGRRPIAAFGNTAGDQEMLEYTTAGKGARLGMLVLHDDAKREYAYGPAQGLPDTKVGTFSQALYDDAKKKGWTVISMKDDWKQLFSFDK
jgi:phosphoglycolate phosphatase-like HAD superfamily hydrolase